MIDDVTDGMPTGGNAAKRRWAALRDEARGCTRCDLYKCATQTVFGEGPVDARMMFVGEQPGDQEDLAGRPFVGPAGQMFDAALERGRDRSRRDLCHQRGQAFQIRAARQAAHPPEARQRRDRGLPLVDRAGARADPPAGDRRARRHRGALAARQDAHHQPRARTRRIALDDGGECWVTVHPSFLLRIPERDRRRRARQVRRRPQTHQENARRSWPARIRSAAWPCTVRGAPGEMLLSPLEVGK